MSSFSISYKDLVKFHYFADTTEGGDRGWKQAQRELENRLTLLITLIYATINITCSTLYRIKPQSWPHTCVMSHCFLCEKNHIFSCSSQNVSTPARSRSSGKIFRTQNTVYTKVGGILAWTSCTQLMVMQTSLEIAREYNFSSSWISASWAGYIKLYIFIHKLQSCRGGWISVFMPREFLIKKLVVFGICDL
jgi:hypothetical protein